MICAFCDSGRDVARVDVAPRSDSVPLCKTCAEGIKGHDVPTDHWHCLSTAMWSQEPAVQVLCWRMLNRLRDQAFAADALEMLYLEPEVLDWAQSGGSDVIHRDSNGDVLAAGDTVVLIKDLVVKGGGFTAKRGTAVTRISLLADTASQIEGRVEGQRIVILTEFVKKR
ncbi:hypothetical protein AQS8620_01124 [Aquimixticola soesokkakensis]|uniref:Protein YjdM C-terminal domain-containing protein n=1 Tax=Aquimixticola soesokkakensis TaxID=1519096 RepID=A0A1Y5S604_9RHOB|nr:alkylphosphonate utilization protein [Aquimixticola soesokkakensis]SLN33005.1 hypothetical protein AQS8620_01124 [Aquimixticola soesokkakensis]